MITDIVSHKSLSLDEKRDLLASLLRTELQRTPFVESTTDAVQCNNGPQSATDERIVRHRSQFPALANKSYFNYGAHGTLPRPAIDAILRSYEYVQQWGPFSSEINEWVRQEINRTISCLAAQLGASPETIALTENVTTGCNIVLWGIDWQPGDHILFSDCENPGIVAAIEELARRFHLVTSTCPLLETQTKDEALDAIEQNLRPNTQLVVLSHVLWNTGQVLPLAEIVELCGSNATTRGRTRILIDGAQSVGVLPLNLAASGVDFYAFTAHKWVCGPEGVGGLFVALEALEELHPTFVGWRSLDIRKTDGALSWQRGARRFHVSTSAYPLLAGMRSAVEIHDNFESSDLRYERIVELSRYLWEKLRAAGDGETSNIECLQTSPPESGLVAVRLKSGAHEKAVQFLEAENCFVRSMYDPQCLRFSLHYFTTFAEVDHLLELLRNLRTR